MIIHGIFIYSLSVVFDSASYIKTFGLTDADLSQSIIYKVAIFAVLVAIASGEKSCCLKSPADGGSQSGDHHRVWFCDGSALELR